MSSSNQTENTHPATPTVPSGDLPHALVDSSADRRLDVLRRVATGSSISQAAREVGISYKAAWQALDTLSNLSGLPLVERTVGGAGGGGARITLHGEQLLALADELARARRQVLARFTGGVELAAGLGLRTSMRNQLPCRVEACDPVGPQDPLVWVRLRTSGGERLTASLTRESADLLGLFGGLSVLVLCKATAVRITPLPEDAGKAAVNGDAAQPGTGRLAGVVERVTPGEDRDEVVLALDGGGHWVGFADHPARCRVGGAAHATMAAASLVVGLPG